MFTRFRDFLEAELEEMATSTGDVAINHSGPTPAQKKSSKKVDDVLAALRKKKELANEKK